MRAIYITRSDLAFWGMSHTFAQAPLAVAQRYALTLCLPVGCQVPEALQRRCAQVVYFDSVGDLLAPSHTALMPGADVPLFTGFDFASMRVALRLKERHGCPWTVFCWDPPALSWRDGPWLLRKAIDGRFRHYVRRCDKLVSSVHPGLLHEIGLDECGGKAVCVKNGCDVARLAGIPEEEKTCDVGVLSAMTRQKGGNLVRDALAGTGIRCQWISGKPQDEAWKALKQCKVALLPYLPTHALKWNYPIKLFEYLALGMPIVAADNPGIADIIDDGKNGLLFKSGNAQDLRRALKRAVGDEALRARMSAQARETAWRHDWSDIRKAMVSGEASCP